MEDKLNRLRELYAGVSNELEAWMKADLKTPGKPSAYSIDQAVMFMRTSYMWLLDAAAQAEHCARISTPGAVPAPEVVSGPPELKVEKGGA